MARFRKEPTIGQKRVLDFPMGFTFDKLRTLGPAAFVLKGIIVAIVLDALLLGFILLRRTYRKRYFARRDRRLLELRRNWDALLEGEIPYESWRTNSSDRTIVETIVLDAFEAARADEAARFLQFLRASGLIEKMIFDARSHRGWRRLRALVALGRTRAPEGIPALAEGLNDRKLETRLAALRGLGRMACPEAGREILSWLLEAGLQVPALPLQMALIQCCAESPQILLPFLQHADGPLREVLGRVVGEVATPALAEDLLPFVDDDLPELRAAAARAFSNMNATLAIDTLNELSKDTVWFVRLRSIVSLGQLCEIDAVPTLLRGLTDSHRLVRLRAAEGLVSLKAQSAEIFAQVVATRDRYGLHAYLTALENTSQAQQLENAIKASAVSEQHKTELLEVLRTSKLPVEQLRDGLALTQAASTS
jgi:HEAT repeat protein